MIRAIFFVLGFLVGFVVWYVANRRAMRDYLRALYLQLRRYHLPQSNHVIVPLDVLDKLFDGVSDAAQKS